MCGDVVACLPYVFSGGRVIQHSSCSGRATFCQIHGGVLAYFSLYGGLRCVLHSVNAGNGFIIWPMAAYHRY